MQPSKYNAVQPPYDYAALKFCKVQFPKKHKYVRNSQPKKNNCLPLVANKKIKTSFWQHSSFLPLHTPDDWVWVKIKSTLNCIYHDQIKQERIDSRKA